MKITLRELKQLIRESVQEEIQKEGLMDTVKGFFGGKKKPVETKPVDQNQPNIFTGGKIENVTDFGNNTAESEFYDWAVRTWSLGKPEVAEKNINHFLGNLEKANIQPGQELPDLWWRIIRGSGGNKKDPTYGDLLKVKEMAEFLLKRVQEEKTKNMVREEVKRQLRSKR